MRCLECEIGMRMSTRASCRPSTLRLIRTVYLLTGDYHRAEDVVQATFVSLYLRWGRISGMQDPGGVRPQGRRQSGLVLATSPLLGERCLPSSSIDVAVPGPAEGVSDHDAVWSAVLTLPARQRAVIVLRFYEHLTEAQTAEILGMAVGTVKSHHHTGCQRLTCSESRGSPVSTRVRPPRRGPGSAPCTSASPTGRKSDLLAYGRDWQLTGRPRGRARASRLGRAASVVPAVNASEAAARATSPVSGTTPACAEALFAGRGDRRRTSAGDPAAPASRAPLASPARTNVVTLHRQQRVWSVPWSQDLARASECDRRHAVSTRAERRPRAALRAAHLSRAGARDRARLERRQARPQCRKRDTQRRPLSGTPTRSPPARQGRRSPRS